MGKSNEKQSVIHKVLLGIGVSMLLCFALTAVASQLVLSQKIGEGSIEVLVTIVLILALTTGNNICGFREKQPIPVIASNTLAVGIILFVVGLVMEGEFENLLLRLGAVVIGSLISCLLCLKNHGKLNRKKKHYR